MALIDFMSSSRDIRLGMDHFGALNMLLAHCWFSLAFNLAITVLRT